MIDKIYNIKKNIVIISGGAGYLGGQFSKTISSIGGIPLILDNNEKALKV